MKNLFWEVKKEETENKKSFEINIGVIPVLIVIAALIISFIK
jgi:hypothetical protein|nr:MAG TPA: hypothetical protein [Caudoviricetes sp.]